MFKIETIGDCYVAVTGLPEAQLDHALIMVQFSAECLHKMSQTMDRLAGYLGDDTKDLNFRIGLHSGPVTAGVLRGEKARFQLFGDTVNTAARMESSGEPGRIHISAATATLLFQVGKGEWLSKREDLVDATYWVAPPVVMPPTTDSNDGYNRALVKSGDCDTGKVDDTANDKDIQSRLQSYLSKGHPNARLDV